MESSGRAADLDGSESGDPRAGCHGGREVAGEESDASDQMVAEVTYGVDLDADAGGLAGEKLRADFEEKFVVPGWILAADPVSSGPDLVIGVDPDECVGLHAAQVG